jgi:hypothetical protein
MNHNVGLIHHEKNDRGESLFFHLEPTQRNCFFCHSQFNTYTCPKLPVSTLKEILDHLGENPDVCSSCLQMKKRFDRLNDKSSR